MFKQYNVNIRQIYLATCLYDGIEDNNVSAIESLLTKNGANPNIILPEKGISPFHLIVGNPVEETAEEVTKLFLQNGGDANVRSKENMTPVHVAAAWGRSNVLELLLKCGGDVNLKDDEGKTPFDYAKSENHTNVLSLLHEFNENNIPETSHDSYNISLEKIIINNGSIIAEYDPLQTDKELCDNINNLLKQLPKIEINSYIQNWCSLQIDTTKEDIDLDNLKKKHNLESEKMYFNDEFVTRRRKKYSFDTSENIVQEASQIETFNKLNTENSTENFVNKLKQLNVERSIECLDDISCIFKTNYLSTLCEKNQTNWDKSTTKSIECNMNSLRPIVGSENYFDTDIMKNKQSHQLENNIDNILIDELNNLHLENSFNDTNQNKQSHQLENNIDNILIDELNNLHLENSFNDINPKSDGCFLEDNNNLNESFENTESSFNNLETSDKIQKDENSFEKLDINKLSDESPCYVKNSSRESGVLTIESDVSDFHNSLEPVKECRYIGVVNSSDAKTDENSTYITCDESNFIRKHEMNVLNSIITLDESETVKSLIFDIQADHLLNNAMNIESLMTSDASYKNNSNDACIKNQDLNNAVAVPQFTLDESTVYNEVNLKGCRNATFSIGPSNSKMNNAYLIEHSNGVSEGSTRISVLSGSSNETFLSVAEEYKYMDEEEGIVLIERRYLVTPQINLNDNISCSSPDHNTLSSLPTTVDYDTDTLRKELTIRGEEPGPITSSTKRVYLRRLMRLQKSPIDKEPPLKTTNRVYSVELEKTLRNPSWSEDLTLYKELEAAMVKQFSCPDPSKKWREGIAKASFTYLLMDPRVTQNLPFRSESLEKCDTWKTFLSSIFYVGKGKRSRPYQHLYDAVLQWDQNILKVTNKKIQHILDIWNDGKGVVCLHIFQNVIPVEAYTREAAIISAIKLPNLKNVKTGDFYGISATWNQRQKRLLGVYLLYRAMYIFLNEGERQLRPHDI